jgi:hypothetical protein
MSDSDGLIIEASLPGDEPAATDNTEQEYGVTSFNPEVDDRNYEVRLVMYVKADDPVGAVEQMLSDVLDNGARGYTFSTLDRANGDRRWVQRFNTYTYDEYVTLTDQELSSDGEAG